MGMGGAGGDPGGVGEVGGDPVDVAVHSRTVLQLGFGFVVPFLWIECLW